MKTFLPFFILFSFPLCAEMVCNFSPIKIYIDETLSSCEQPAVINVEFRKALTLTSKTLKVPPSIEVKTTARSDQSAADGLITIPLVFARTPDAPNQYALPIWLHELGHIIFDYNLSLHLPFYKKILAAHRPHPFNTLIMPYAELFADTFAVTLLNNGDAIYKILIDAGNVPRWEMDRANYLSYFEGRSFLSPRNEMHNWSQTNDVYDLFSPVRFHIGTKLLGKIPPEHLLQLVYLKIEREVDKRVKEKATPSYPDQNVRLINSLLY